MSNRILYNDGFIILEQDFKYFPELKLLYLLFFIDPKNLVDNVNIKTKETITYFDSQYPLVRLFSQVSIYDNWAKMSVSQRNVFYGNVVDSNRDICELIDYSLKIETTDSLIDVLKKCQFIVQENITIDFPTVMVPIGKLSSRYENYYILNSLKFDEPKNNLYLSNELSIEFNEIFLYNYGAFGGWTNIWNSVFSALNSNEIFIGGKAEGNITLETVEYLKKHLVKKSEAETYINQQNSILMQEFFEDTNLLEVQEKLTNQQRKRSIKEDLMGPIALDHDDQNIIKNVNSILGEHLTELKEMLRDQSKKGRNFVQDEKKYQAMLLKIFPYIFPQYTHFIREFKFKIDGNSHKNSDIPDFLALNSDLSVDVIEIKTPYKKIFTKTRYRENYIFDREVLGLITQTQKYIYNLERNSVREETNILQKFQENPDFSIPELNIASPKGIVIVGRGPQNDPTLSSTEKREMNLSLSIMKNRYQDILDFLTFDDVVDRIERVIARSTSHIDILD